MRRLTFLVVLLVGTIGVFEWLSQGFVSTWEPQMRSYLEATAGRLTGTRVHMDGITLAAFHRVRLLNVQVIEPEDPLHPLFQAATIELTLSLIDLPRAIYHRRPYEAIGLISLENPVVRLSKETLARHARTGDGSSNSFLPPLFTLEWNAGFFQWRDPRAPHGAWTIYQSKGIVHIRGPQTSVTVHGNIEEARDLQLRFLALGHRWAGQVLVSEGRSQGMLALLQTFAKRPLLPAGWTMRGGFRFEARASGSRYPQRGDDWMQLLDRASLAFSPDPQEPKPQGPSLGLSGNLTYRKGEVTASHISFDTPYMEGTGKATLSLGSDPGKSPMALDAFLTSGKLGRWPIEDATVKLRQEGGRWEFVQNTFRLLHGTITAKGYMSKAQNDVSITAQNISLAALGSENGVSGPSGNLNASCALKGPLDDWQVAGAWWLTDAMWGKTPLGEARGDFDVTPDHFEARAKSEKSRFRVALAGSRSEKAFELEDLEISLPSGASFSGSARVAHPKETLQGSFTASDINVPADLPLLAGESNGPTGTLQAQGKLAGFLHDPSLKISVQSSDLAYNGQAFGDSAAELVLDKSTWEVPSFHLGPGIEGKLKQGAGSLKIQNAAVGKWTLKRGAAHFTMAPRRLDLTDFSIQTKDAAMNGRGKASWETDTTARTHISLESKGSLTSARPGETWTVPFDIAGRYSAGHGMPEADMRLHATVLGGPLHGEYTLSGAGDHTVGRFAAHLENARWRAFPFTTDIQGVWSKDGLKPLGMKGTVKTGGTFEFSGQLSPDAQASGTLKLDGFNLTPLGESLRFPKPLEGTAKATLTVSGPLAQLHVNGHLEGGPVTYAPTSDHPFQVAHIAVDMTLAPLAGDPTISHLVINEGEAKTAEELIRFRSGSYIEFAGEKQARLSLGTDIRNLHLGIFTLFGGLDLNGTWQIKPEGFAIQTKAQTHSLFINDYELEEGLLNADYFNGVLQFSQPPNAPPLVTGSVDFHNAPQLKFTNFYISGKDQQGLQMTGSIGPSLWDFKLVGRGLDMSTLGELSGFPYSLTGGANVQVHGTGDPNHPHVEGKVDLENGTALGMNYRSGSAVFVWQDGRISFTKLLLTDPGHYTLDGAGVFPLKQKTAARNAKSEPTGNVDFSIRLRDSNLSLLQSFSNEVKQARGPVEGILQIKGTLDDPIMHGSLRITNGSIVGAHYFKELKNANLSLEFEGETITIKEASGKSGQGEFRGSGSIVLAGFTPAQYDVKLEIPSAKGVDVQVPELAIPESPLAKRFNFLTAASRVDVQGHVSLRGPAESPTFSGEGIFSNGHFTFPPSRKKPPSPAIMDWFRRITWDVNLRFIDNAWFENELVQANVLGNLALKGPSDKLAVNGGLDITEGKISYLGLQFDIRDAHYDIRSDASNGTVVNTPFVRGVAESQIQAVDTVSGVAGSSGGSRLNVNDTITLNIDYAPIDEIKPRLTSAANPTMSQDKLLARVTQTDVENLTPQERNYLYQKQLVSLIDTSLTTPLAQNVLKKTGLADRLRVQHVFDPNTVSGQDLNTPTGVQQQQSTAANLLANTKYTIEKDLSSRLSMGYGVRFVQSTSIDPDFQQQKLDLVSDVQLSYRWFRNVYLRGDFDLPSSNPYVQPDRRVTIEPRWRFGWWGNTNKQKPKSTPQPTPKEP